MLAAVSQLYKSVAIAGADVKTGRFMAGAPPDEPLGTSNHRDRASTGPAKRDASSRYGSSGAISKRSLAY
jgi:hypothetical protein